MFRMPSGALQRSQLLIHWVIAHAAAAGTLAALWGELKFGFYLPDPHFGYLVLMAGCCLLLLQVQQLILRGANAAVPYWAARSSVAALVAGLCGRFLVWWVQFLFADNPRVGIELLATLAGLLTGGVLFGYVQGFGIFASWREHLIWVIVHFAVIVPVVFVMAMAYGVLRTESPLLLGTIGGATYGYVTGIFLLMILPLPARAAGAVK